MRKSIILSVWLLLAANSLYCQKYYHAWPYGYDGKIGKPDFSTSYFDISADTVKNYKVNHNVNFSATVASLCDSAGILQLYTNGVAIYDKNGKKIPYSDSLNLGVYFDSDKKYGFSSAQTHFLIHAPSNSHIIFLIHESFQKDSAIIIRKGPLYYTTIKIDSAQKYVVTEKNIFVFNDQIGKIEIFKHGDGIRWWGIVPQLRTNKYFFFLIDSIGMHYSHFVESGLPMFGTYCHAEGIPCISPDGSKYLRWSNVCGIRLFDVDRCTGELYNPRSIDLDSTISPGAGAAFSPNSRFVYVCSNTSVYQIDTDAENPKLLEVAKYDGFVDFFSTSFCLMDLQNDGKIYINTNNSNKKLHVIEYPDSAGMACNFKQHSVELASLMALTMPRTPNHLLGVLKGSPCDTSSALNEPGPLPGGIRIFPNPAFDQLTVELDDGLAHYKAYLVRCYNMQGRLLYQGVFPPFAYIHNIDVSGFAAGMYLVEILNEEGRRVVSKFVKE